MSWSAVSLTANGVATVDFKASFVDSEIVLQIDADGDGVPEDSDLGTVTAITPRAFQALAAVQNPVDPSGHMIEVLFTQDVDLRSLLPNDPNRFQIPGKVSNGGLVPIEEDIANFFEVLHKNPFEGLRDTRIVRVVFDNPVSPLIANQKIAISALKSVSGQLLDDEEVPLTFPADFDQGVEVRGTVYGSDGLPVPFARVELFETDFFYHFPTPCRQHRTAAVQADANGRFHFDYVRQTSCGDVFSVAGTDPGSGRHGSSRARVRFTGSTMQVDIVMLGRGTIRGKVRYEDGTIPPALDVIAYSPVFFEGKEARLGPDGTYQVGDVPVGTVTLGANDREGGYVFQAVEVPAAGAVVQRDLTIIRRPSTRAVGEVRGVVLETDGVTPVYNAYLALYVDGELVGVQRSDPDGLFDFGTVLAGRAQLEGFDGETGLSGVQVEFDVKPDQVNQVTLRLKNDRGTVQGHVYVQTLSTATPLAGVVVWVSGTPFNTVTDANGYYRLEGVFAGDRSVLVADMANNRQTSAQVSLTGNGGTVTRDLYFVESVGSGLVGEVIGFNGNPVPGALVHLSTGGDQWFGEAVTDAAGRFSFPNLQVGTYVVHAIKAKDGGRQTATIRFQGETPFVRVQFKKGTIRGSVTIENPSGPVAVVALVTYRTTVVRGGMVGLDWETHTLQTRADGTFELPNVLLGSYVLTVSNALHGEKTVRGELVYAGEIAEHEIEFEPNGTIRGVVLNWDGTPPEIVDQHGPEVVLRHPNFLADVEIDAEGRFRFDLVPPGGRFPIEVSWQDGAISRQAQIWVTFTQFGQELDVEIRLPRQGAVSGYVEDANGNPIPGAVVTLQEHAFPQRLLIQNADGEGHFSYTNIFAGVVSLSAKAPSLGGLGAKKTVTIATEGEEVDALLVLESTGEIVGKVLSPEGAGAPVAVPTAQVTLYRGNGLFDTVTSDEAGAFRFRLLPLGSYTVWVFDPRVGRHGRSAVLTLQQNNQVLEQNVTLEGRGNVLGHLYEPPVTPASPKVGIPGATIRLETQSLAPFTTFSSTDLQGGFSFEGIPEGDFRLCTREPEGRRRAWGEGEITREDEDVTVDLYLEESGRVLGSVLKPTGVPTGLFPNANTLIYQDGQVVGATLENPFSFAGIIADREFELRSFEVGGGHQAAQRGLLTLADEDGEVTVDLRMVPLGSAAITVNDSFGNPVPGAGVTVQNNGFYGAKLFQGATAANGRVVFEGAGEGSLSVYAAHPVSGLRGSGNGTITAEGQVAEIAVKLEDSGRVRGRVVLPDAVTPAVKAMVVVTAAGRRLQALTDTDGAFSFASVPLGPVALLVQGVIQDGKGTGEINRGGTLASNGQEIDFGLLILDDAPPYVKALSPAPGTRNLPLSTAVAIDFSEIIDSARFESNWVSFQTLSGNGVGYTVAWQDSGRKMVLTPSAPLTSFTGYEVVVHTAFDLAGRALSDRVKTVFHTVDIVPPNVIDVLPRDGQSQVPLNTLIKVTFTEPVATASLSGNALQLTDLTTGQGITTTFLHLAGHREVILTPVEALQNNHRYQLRVQSVQDKSGNVMAQPVTTTFWSPDTIPPQIQSVTPAEGTTYTAGDRIPVTVAATDERGLGEATVAYAGWTFTDATAPYAWSVPAPVVSQPSDVTLTVKVKDIFGNESTATRTIRVEPRINANAPQVAIACAANGDAVVPEVQAEFIMTASDDEGIESYRFLVDGQVVQATSPVDLPAAETSFFWAPPKGAVAGTSYLVRIEARDFAGNVGFRELTVSIPTGTILTGSKSLTSTQANQALVLANGTFTIRDPLSFTSVILVRGATLVTPDDDPDMAFTVTGALKMQCGSTVRPGAWGDVLLTLGSANVAPGALIDVSGRGFAGGDAGHPDGYAPAGVAGASGMNAAGSHGGHGGPAGNGQVYGSITEPRLGGGGGATGSFAANTSAGGGALELAVTGDLVLGGELRAQGKDGCSGGAGAGGGVLVHAGTVRGGGLIDASGGSHEPGCSWSPGAGGGGRVAVHGNLDGFDPAAQARVWGGGLRNNAGFAAPGTVYFKTPQQTWGVLVIDRGTWNGEDREGAPTELPALQNGEYRFDHIELRNGAAVESDTPVVTTDLSLTGEVTLEGPVSTQNLTLEETAVLRPAGGGEMLLSVPGRLTVAAGVRIDVSDRGYAGGVNGAPDGGAPAGVPGANGTWAAGSHGGRGISTAPVFDSVYDPRLGGGGGAKGAATNHTGGAGGGVLAIEAGTVVLDGELRSRADAACANGGGAGGTVQVRAGTLRGSGRIDVSGSDDLANCAYDAGAGGGGRVSLLVGTFDGFDPAAQVRAWGGKRKLQPEIPYASPGTVYYRRTADTYGVLRIDNGEESGVDRKSMPTQLPALGGGAVTELLAAGGGDFWIDRGSAFPIEWHGAWVTLSNSASPDLGSFRVAEIGADGRALLAGVSPEAASAATTYRGEYRFDRLEVANGSDLQATDRIVATDTTLEGDLQLTADLRGQNLLIKAGAKVVPVTGSGGELQFIATGTMTVETGAVIDVSNLGYPEAGAPLGVTPASGWANGGTHGGAGGIGEFYDSVYEPWLPGAGGTAGGWQHGWEGGGVVRVTAGTLVLNGTIRARGKDACGGAGGAGGTVLVRTTGTLSGTGQIDVSGGTAQWAGCGYAGNSGGGGRAALHVGAFSGFDPATQVNVQGGVIGVAGPGTLLTRTSTQAYGALRVDQRATGGDYLTTVLPSVGRGTVGSTWPATNPADLWIQSQDANVKFSLGVAGIWARVGGIEYPILELSADRKRILLQGAAGKVTVGQRYLGIYKFDSVTVAGRAKLEFKDGDVIGTTSVASGSTLTRIESTPPTVSFNQPAAGTLYASGQSITVAVTATDASGIASVTFRLGAQSFTDTAAPYEWTVPAPVVEAEGDHTIEVTAMDVPANEAVVTRTIRIRPPVLGAPPAVTLSCPTPGALLAPGTGLDFHVAASSDDGVERVDLFVGTETTAAATDLSAPYVLRFTAPAGVLDGAILQVKLRARTYTGATAEVTYPVTVVAGSVIVTDTTIAAANASLDNQSVVVAGGTLTIQGVHNFRDLVVLDGARVTHSETTTSQVHTLEVGVQRDLYVACGGGIDVTGRGYLGAVNGQRAYGYANSQTEGALSQVGGSHGGRGGRFDGSSPVYGNVFDPQAPGAGGGHDGSTKGRDGGGVIRVTALGDVVIDGAVLADGETGSSGGGAGGSIRIHAETLTGAGRIQANGSAGGNANVGGGSGGRVALYAVTMDAGLVGRTTTAGAKTASTDASRWGAAGTLFIQRDTDEHGLLIIDNEGTASTQLTDLQAVRPGIVDAVGETGFTDNEADFRHGVAGVEVAFNDDPALYMVVGHAHTARR